MGTQALQIDRTAVSEAVRDMYTAVAVCPTRPFHFPTGRNACLLVGYPEEELDALPGEAVESFAGVGYPFLADAIEEGQTVVDVGSGSGTDLLTAARRVGPNGRAIGIDMNEAMIVKGRLTAETAGLDHVEFVLGDAEELPLPESSADVVTSNGVINLVPDKEAAFREIYRILRPGGQVQIADIVLSKPVSSASKANPDLWAECIVGAETEEAYLEMIRAAGFRDLTVIDRHDYFSNSPNADTRKVARDLGAHSIVCTAVKS